MTTATTQVKILNIPKKTRITAIVQCKETHFTKYVYFQAFGKIARLKFPWSLETEF